MKTITIPAQESAAALASAFANALATEIGWTVDEDGNIKKDGVDIFFKPYISSPNVGLTVSNGIINPQTSAYCRWSATDTYRLDLITTTGGSIAVGVGLVSSNVPRFGTIITRNEAGVYVGITIYSNNIYQIRGLDTVSKNIRLSVNSDAGVSTSILKAADIWGGKKFNDLYYLMSCPLRTTDLSFYINNKFYRGIGVSDSYMYFALPDD